MCGIVGITGKRQAVPLIVEGLKRLEYRGYDSAGLAVVHEGALRVERAAGKLAALERRLVDQELPGSLALGHTRWATHGLPNTVNAHPHTDREETIAVVHNGIIENATALREWLIDKGYEFRSETDTEVLAHLIADLYTDSLEAAVVAALRRVEGTYGLAVLSTRDPDRSVSASPSAPSGRSSRPERHGPRPCAR